MNVTQNILVLGGNGFIGAHLVDRLIADGLHCAFLTSTRSDIERPWGT